MNIVSDFRKRQVEAEDVRFVDSQGGLIEYRLNGMIVHPQDALYIMNRARGMDGDAASEYLVNLPKVQKY